MRTVKQSPVIRVRRLSPYTSARQRWKQRVIEGNRRYHQSDAEEYRRNAVEPVPEDDTRRQQQEDCRDEDEREPSCSVSSPLRYSNNKIGESSSASIWPSAHDSLHSHHPNSQPAQRVPDNITLLGLLANAAGMRGTTATPSLPSSSTNTSSGDVNSMDHRFQTLSVAKQQQRRRAEKALLKERESATRRRVLMNAMGMPRYYKALALVKEMKRLRQTILGSCSSASIESSPSLLNSKSKVVISKSAFEGLPEACRAVLTKTSLIAALEHTETERLTKLPWDELVLEAHQTVNSYREWQSISETRE